MLQTVTDILVVIMLAGINILFLVILHKLSRVATITNRVATLSATVDACVEKLLAIEREEDIARAVTERLERDGLVDCLRDRSLAKASAKQE